MISASCKAFLSIRAWSPWRDEPSCYRWEWQKNGTRTTALCFLTSRPPQRPPAFPSCCTLECRPLLSTVRNDKSNLQPAVYKTETRGLLKSLMTRAIPLSLLAIRTFRYSIPLGSFCRYSSQFGAIPNTLITTDSYAASRRGVRCAPNSVKLFETERGRGTPLGPPLGRGVSCGAVACQVKRYTSLIEKSLEKYFGN